MIPIRDGERGVNPDLCRRTCASACRRRTAPVLRRSPRRRRLCAAIERLARLGATIAEIDIEPFYETARLLYEGPWLAERYEATRAVIASAPESLHPVTREILLGGARQTATEAFAAFYQLEHLRRDAEPPSSASTYWCCPRRRRCSRSNRSSPIRSASIPGSAPTRISSTCSTSAALPSRRRSTPAACRSASR